MEELQPKITQLNELMSEMKDADGIDPDELSQLQYELKEFDSRMESVNEDTAQVCFALVFLEILFRIQRRFEKYFVSSAGARQTYYSDLWRSGV